MATTTKRGGARKGAGRPPKVPDGLSEVLYLRVAPDLTALLDQVAEREREAHPGRSVSRADVARELLYAAAAARLGGKK